MNDYTVVDIYQQPIELCKLLKIANLVGGGGEAKIVISEGYVLLNGEVEYQKRKKVYPHDVIEFNGEVIQVALAEHTEVPDSVNSEQPVKNKNANKNSAPSKSKKKANNNKAKKAEPQGIPSIRKPINF